MKLLETMLKIIVQKAKLHFRVWPFPDGNKQTLVHQTKLLANLSMDIRTSFKCTTTFEGRLKITKYNYNPYPFILRLIQYNFNKFNDLNESFLSLSTGLRSRNPQNPHRGQLSAVSNPHLFKEDHKNSSLKSLLR